MIKNNIFGKYGIYFRSSNGTVFMRIRKNITNSFDFLN